jgi:hypothetical protein
MKDAEYDHSVFINCPFDVEYTPLFEAVVFAINDAGFRAKCARERLDSSQLRLQKIIELISSSRYSIHDLSRTGLDDTTSLPRFNMPLELGIDLGCKAFSPDCNDKSLLISTLNNTGFRSSYPTSAGRTFINTATVRK